MPSKTHWTIGLFFITALLALWFFIHSSTLHITKNKPTNPDAFITTMTVTQINQKGQLQNRLQSPHATHYERDNRTLFDHPHFVVYLKNQPPWYIQADSAKALNGQKRIILSNHVRIRQPAGPNSHNITFLTNKLTYYPDRSLATTDQPVTIQQPGSITHAVGLNADLKKGAVTLLSKSSGQYGTKPFKTPSR